MRLRIGFIAAILALLGTTFIVGMAGAQSPQVRNLVLNHNNEPGGQDPDCDNDDGPPPDTSLAGTGTATITFSATGGSMVINVTHNVEGTTNAHIHGPLPATGVVQGLAFTSSSSAAANNGTATGTWNFPESQKVNVAAGRFYVNIHSGPCPGGAIAGTIGGAYVPTLNEWGMILLSLALVATGIAFVMRRKPSLA